MKSEFDFIESIKKKFSLSKIGDDCAVLPKDSRTDLVITTDLIVEDIDFRLTWTKPEFLGHKSLAVSLSDVAAMGAKPVWSMVSIGVPAKIWKTDFVEKFYNGYMKLAKKFDVELVGGDVSKTPDKIVIDSIVVGEVKKGKAILRSGAKPNQPIFVTGELGGAAAALKLLEKGERYGSSEFDNLLLKQLTPNPQVELGQIIAEKNLATAMIDISDGLVGDLFHICRASKVGASLTEYFMPEQSPLDNFFPVFNLTEAEDNLYFGGEDYQLLFTGSRSHFEIENILKNYPVKHIGNINSNVEIITLNNQSSSRILEPKGFRHF